MRSENKEQLICKIKMSKGLILWQSIKKGMWEGINTSLYKTQRIDLLFFFFAELNIARPARRSLGERPTFFEGICNVLQN